MSARIVMNYAVFNYTITRIDVDTVNQAGSRRSKSVDFNIVQVEMMTQSRRIAMRLKTLNKAVPSTRSTQDRVLKGDVMRTWGTSRARTTYGYGRHVWCGINS